MTALKPATTSRKDAIQAVARVKALLPLIEDDDFLLEVLSNAQDVVDASALGGKISRSDSTRTNYSSATRSKKTLGYAARPHRLTRH